MTPEQFAKAELRNERELRRKYDEKNDREIRELMTTPTPAAMRAANAILDHAEGLGRRPSSDELRDIIDAETLLPEVIGVLSDCVDQLDWYAKEHAADDQYIARLDAARDLLARLEKP